MAGHQCSNIASGNISLEELRKNPLVQQFAAVPPEKANILPSIKFFSDLCKAIYE